MVLSLCHFLDKQAEARRVRSLACGGQQSQDSNQALWLAWALHHCTVRGTGVAVGAECISVEWMKTQRFGLCRREISSRSPVLQLSLLWCFLSLLLHRCCYFRSEIDPWCQHSPETAAHLCSRMRGFRLFGSIYWRGRRNDCERMSPQGGYWAFLQHLQLFPTHRKWNCLSL